MIHAGLDQFIERGKFRSDRIGLLTNHTGITCRGTQNWVVFLEEGYRLSAIFGPEHGFHGTLQDGKHEIDARIGDVPVYSLYGSRTRPESSQLENVDLFVIDLQEVGCRNYTYLYSAAYCLEVCAETDIPVIVLDRPAPIGSMVEGNPIDPKWSSFVGDYRLANRTGLTMGEFATYLQSHYVPNLELTVVKVTGWQKENGLLHSTRLSQTHTYPWVPPSPNIPTVDAALCYSGTVLFEGTNVSEGRGTTRPFEVVGAPWIDAAALVSRLGKLQGCVLVPFSFIPMFSKYEGERCEGVCIHVIDHSSFKPLHTAVMLMTAIKSLHPQKLLWQPEGTLDRLSGGHILRDGIDKGLDGEEVYASLTCSEETYRDRVESSLLYR